MVKTEKIDSTQERILAAAKRVFLEQGMAGARMQDIADKAGINKALLHYYFRNKDKLFETIFKEVSSQFFPKITDVIESDMPLFGKIERFCSEYIDMLQKNSFMPMFVLSEVHKQPQRFKERFWKNMGPVLARFVGEIEVEMKKNKIKKMSAGQLFLNMVSLCIFPFIAKPLWMVSSGMDEARFKQFMEERKKEVPKFIIESIKN
ncbi:MAG: TetR/AcrR family transcriptional regulator [Bacteroidetes bacterium]|nr:TetR/AcrR family transcriptional regulator [Bacteroidota bacterium]